MDEMINNRDKEINDAIIAGEESLRYLKQAKDCLNSAGGWGWIDILGGGLISTFLKHSNMRKAESLVQDARRAMKRFQKELTDVDTVAEFRIDVGDFLSFADYFFDGIIADWLVQSKIAEAKKQVNNAIQRVEYILDQLKRL